MANAIARRADQKIRVNAGEDERGRTEPNQLNHVCEVADAADGQRLLRPSTREDCGLVGTPYVRMAKLARQTHFGRQIVRTDSDHIHALERGDSRRVLYSSGTFQQYFDDGRVIQRTIEFFGRHFPEIEMRQGGDRGSVAQGREAAGRDDLLRLLHRFNSRCDDSQDPAVQEPADEAVLALRNTCKRREAQS